MLSYYKFAISAPGPLKFLLFEVGEKNEGIVGGKALLFPIIPPFDSSTATKPQL